MLSPKATRCAAGHHQGGLLLVSMFTSRPRKVMLPPLTLAPAWMLSVPTPSFPAPLGVTSAAREMLPAPVAISEPALTVRLRRAVTSSRVPTVALHHAKCQVPESVQVDLARLEAGPDRYLRGAGMAVKLNTVGG